MSNTIYITSATPRDQRTKYLAETYTFLSGLKQTYPRFDYWWRSKVIPGIQKNTRILILEIRDTQIVGVAVLKNTPTEKKLCTLKINAQYRASGLGYRLFEKSMTVLNTNKPLLSVSENRLPEFIKLFNHFGYEFVKDYNGMYIPNNTELSFNGELTKN